MINGKMRNHPLSASIAAILLFCFINLHAQVADKRTAGGFSLQAGTGTY